MTTPSIWSHTDKQECFQFISKAYRCSCFGKLSKRLTWFGYLNSGLFPCNLGQCPKKYHGEKKIETFQFILNYFFTRHFAVRLLYDGLCCSWSTFLGISVVYRFSRNQSWQIFATFLTTIEVTFYDYCTKKKVMLVVKQRNITQLDFLSDRKLVGGLFCCCLESSQVQCSSPSNYCFSALFKG